MSDAPKGFKRDKDGILVPVSGIGAPMYEDPGEAIKTYWAGNLRIGCAERTSSGGGWHFGPCGKTAKHDPDHNGNPTKCGIHSQAAKDRREAKRKARLDAWRAANARRDVIRKLDAERTEIIQAIADGHNDPRALCADWLKRRSET